VQITAARLVHITGSNVVLQRWPSSHTSFLGYRAAVLTDMSEHRLSIWAWAVNARATGAHADVRGRREIPGWVYLLATRVEATTEDRVERRCGRLMASIH